MEKKILSLLGMLILLAINQIWAQEKKENKTKYNLGEVLVTATKVESYQAEVGSSSTVITMADIEKTGKKTVGEVLRDVPGVSVTQSGSFGGETQVYLRGSKPGHTLVLIDGIEVNDPIKSDSSFDFAHLSIDNIERIEVVRGPQSPLYGSDAMAGVINIITKLGSGKPKIEFSSEGGSFKTFRENTGLSGATETINYSVSASRLDSEGASKAVNGSEKDGYRNSAISSRIDWKIFDNSELSMAMRFTDAQTQLDEGSYSDELNNTAWWKNIAGKIAFASAINSIWDNKLSFSYSQTQRKYNDNPSNIHNWFKGNINKFEWQHNLSPVDWDIITAGFEYEEQRGFSDGRALTNRIDRKSIDNQGYYLQNQFKAGENLFIIPGLRLDDYQLFGAEITYKISAAYIISQTKTQIKGNWGTGFKAPSLYQLYSQYGNTNLNPDESKSYDWGFEQNLWEDKITFAGTHFHNDFKNMVDFDLDRTSLTYYKYINVGRAETKGVEGEILFKPIEDLKISINYTRTETKDKDSGKKLTKRPENQTGFNINWDFLEKGNLNLKTTSAGHSWNNSSNTQKVEPYTKVDFAASYNLTDNFQIFGRIENIFDREYQEIRGYAAQGRSFYAGSKIVF